MQKTKETILLGISGSIAAYKMADVASSLTKSGYNVETIMTDNATKIIRPITFSTLTGNRCITETFDENVNYNVAHVSLAKKTDILLIAPATANIIAKLAMGLADDMLTTTVLACNCPKLIAPAMNTNMYYNPAVQNNLKTLERYGWKILEPSSGVLACKDKGKGRLPEADILVKCILKELYKPKDLSGVNVLISAGPTRESIDPIRFISNRSSGKMGYALAEAAVKRGANVTLVSGPTNLEAYPGVETINIESAQEMADEILDRAAENDIIIKAAAVADFKPKVFSQEKIKKKDATNRIELVNTLDILETLGKNKGENQFLCGFSMETQDLLENSQAKLESKNADLICANSLTEEGAGFMEDTNIITLITKDGNEKLKKMSKLGTAHRILDKIIELRK